MSDQNLRDLLAQLHARLGTAKSLDKDERESLKTVLHDIEKALGDEDVDAPKPRLEALAVKFEADHPALADSIRQLADLLGKVGI